MVIIIRVILINLQRGKIKLSEYDDIYKKIMNIWVGVGRNTNISRVLHLSSNKLVKKEVSQSISKAYNIFTNEKSSIKKVSTNALILEEKYYYEEKDMELNPILGELKENLFSKNSLNTRNEIIKLRRIKSIDIEKNDIIKFLIIQKEDELLFLPINSNKVVKRANILNIFSSGENTKIATGNTKGTGLGTNIVEINSGVQIPESIAAVFDQTNNKLYVLNVIAFEKMLYINEKNKIQAKTNFDKFVSQDYRIGKENWHVEFHNANEIEKELFKSARAINRLAKYENDSEYTISKIKNAVDQLTADKEKVIFNSKKSKIEVNIDNYKTFIGIIHNGIIKRLISGEVDVLI